MRWTWFRGGRFRKVHCDDMDCLGEIKVEDMDMVLERARW